MAYEHVPFVWVLCLFDVSLHHSTGAESCLTGAGGCSLAFSTLNPRLPASLDASPKRAVEITLTFDISLLCLVQCKSLCLRAALCQLKSFLGLCLLQGALLATHHTLSAASVNHSREVTTSSYSHESAIPYGPKHLTVPGATVLTTAPAGLDTSMPLAVLTRHSTVSIKRPG